MSRKIRWAGRERVSHWWLHNLVAHPLLVLCPPLGHWLHAKTAPGFTGQATGGGQEAT